MGTDTVLVASPSHEEARPAGLGTCQSCLWWDTRYAIAPGRGLCRLATGFRPSGAEARGKGVSAIAPLWTAADFACTQYRPNCSED